MFTKEQHKQLSLRHNHRVYTDEFGDVVWERCVDGEWEPVIPTKEFRDEKHARSFMHYIRAVHAKQARGIEFHL